MAIAFDTVGARLVSAAHFSRGFHATAALQMLASGGALIDIDSTLFIQLGLFALFAFVATRALFRPYLRMREEREAGIEGARALATRLGAEADARLQDYQDKLAAARARARTSSAGSAPRPPATSASSPTGRGGACSIEEARAAGRRRQAARAAAARRSSPGRCATARQEVA
jgi:hypothetical protein